MNFLVFTAFNESLISIDLSFHTYVIPGPLIFYKFADFGDYYDF